CAWTRRSLGHVSVARPRAQRTQRDRCLVETPRRVRDRAARQSQSLISKPVHQRRLQRQTLAATTGAAIIENLKITKLGEKKKRLCQKWGLTPIFSGASVACFAFLPGTR